MSAAHTSRERLVILSDLHIATSAGPLSDPFAEDDALARLLGALASDGRPTRLVLLGDAFDLVLAAGGALDAIADAHPGVFGALGALARAGHSLVVVPGNHDVELLRRPAQERLPQLITLAAGHRDAGARIGFRPWIVYLPGVLYAEHGQQHHDINHFRAVLNDTKTNRRRRGSRPPGLCLDEARIELAALRARRSGAAAMAVRAAALAVDMARAGASTMLRQGRDGGEDRLRYIEIEHGADRPPTARLRRWHESGTTR